MEIGTLILQFLSTFFSAFELSQYGLTVLDLVIVAVILFYCYEGYSLGFHLASIDLLSFITSFLLALLFYEPVGKILSSLFSTPQGLSHALSFFMVALLAEIILSLTLKKVVRAFSSRGEPNGLQRVYHKIYHPLGIFPGLISAFLLLSFIFTLLLTLPASPFLKNQVIESRFGNTFVAHISTFEQQVDAVFGDAVSESLNFLTVKPASDESVALRFTVESPTVDQKSEEQMLILVNKERQKEGLSPLVMDEKLRLLSRDYSEDMLKRGYFAHNNPEGQTPFDRMDQYEIIYTNAGENLALAPSVDLAHKGLMNSPGHRANILSPLYRKVGIGVMDGGIYGKMFSQEFTN